MSEEFSPKRNGQRFSPKRNNLMDPSIDEYRPRHFFQDDRMFRDGQFSPDLPRDKKFALSQNHMMDPSIDEYRPRHFFQEDMMFRDERFSPDLPRDREFARAQSSQRLQSPPRYRTENELRLRDSPSPEMCFQDFYIPKRCAKNIFMYKYVTQNSTTERDPFALLRATHSLECNIDFQFNTLQVSKYEFHVIVELEVLEENRENLVFRVGEGRARSESEARLIAAHQAVDTVQNSCKVIEPNTSYFADGGIPEFIHLQSPKTTPLYQIVQNLDPTNLDRYTIDMILKLFTITDVEDLFFLATEFSYDERILIIEAASKMDLNWRLFGPRHPDAPSDDIISTQHICVFKQKPALQLALELLENGGSSIKYTLVNSYKQYSPEPDKRYSPGPSKRYSPGSDKRYSPGSDKRYSPGSDKQYSPGPSKRYSPGPDKRYSPGPDSSIPWSTQRFKRPLPKPRGRRDKRGRKRQNKPKEISKPYGMKMAPCKKNDCYYFYYKVCARGKSCMYRHEPAAIGCEEVCEAWQKGSCKTKHCGFKHMVILKDRSTVPCYWENKPSGCCKANCPFQHKKDRPEKDKFVLL